LSDVSKTVFSKILRTKKDGVETNSPFKQALGITQLSPHVAFSFQSSASRRFFWLQKASFCRLQHSVFGQETSFDKNVSRITLKKSCEILETANRLEQKIDRLLGYQDIQHIEDLLDEVMKLPVDDYDNWVMRWRIF
jgi:hypothetical protein